MSSSTTTDAGATLPVALIVLGVIGFAGIFLTPRRARR